MVELSASRLGVACSSALVYVSAQQSLSVLVYLPTLRSVQTQQLLVPVPLSDQLSPARPRRNWRAAQPRRSVRSIEYELSSFPPCTHRTQCERERMDLPKPTEHHCNYLG